MLGDLLEKYRQILILVLSTLILAGSGVAVGFGVAEMREKPPAFQSAGMGTVAAGNSVIVTPKTEGPININTASTVELEALPGIGPSKSAAIVNYRKENGPFKTISEIQNVSGIGPKTYAQLKDQITVK